MKLSGCQLEAFVMSHDLQKKHGAFFYADTKNGDALGLSNIKILDIQKLAIVVRDYLRVVRNNASLEIEVEPIDLPQGDVIGTCGWIEEENTFRIYHDQELNDCWARFVICKELMQLYIDAHTIYKYPYSPDDILKQIIELYEARNVVSENIESFEFSEGVAPELQAFIMAVDLMVSTENKPTYYFLGGFISLTETPIEWYDLALMLKYPEFVVKLYRKHIEKQSLVYGGLLKNDDLN